MRFIPSKLHREVLEGLHDGQYSPHSRRELPTLESIPFSYQGNRGLMEAFDYDIDKAFQIHDQMVKSASSESAKEYTRDSSNINVALWQHHKQGIPPDRWKHHINSLDEEFSKNKANAEFHVYHGVPYSPSEYGQHIFLPSYTSTSTDPMQANEFSGFVKHPKDDFEHEHSAGSRHIFKIRVHPNAQAMSMVDISQYPREHEILLGRGALLRVHGKQKVMPNTFIWDAELLGHIRKKI